MGALRRGVRGSARESLQVRYGALQALYYFGTCALGGFAAIFLGYKGLSNSLIGVATGASCILSVVLMPAISILLERKPGLGIPRVVRSLTLGSVACYVVLALAPLPTYAVIVLFAIANAMSLAIAPFLSQLAMGFNRIGMPINFGLARGMGSVSYAVGAVGLSRLVELSSPGVLAGLFVLSGVVLLAVLASMPTCEAPVKAGAVQAKEPRSQADQTLGSTGRAPAACDSAEGMATAAGTVVDAPAGDALGATAGDALDATTGGAPEAPAGDAPGELDASHGAKGRHEDERGGAFREILRERVLLMVLAGFMVAFIACNCLSVYLIDIVVNVGGDTSMYGVAIFCMAASELPAMALVPLLRRRFSTGTLFMVVGAAYLLRNMIVVCATSVPMVFIGLLFQSTSYGLLTPLLTCYIAEVCSPRSEMLGQTLLSVATTGVGAMAGTVCGGVLQDTYGIQAMLLFVAVTTVVAAFMFFIAGARARREETARREEAARQAEAAHREETVRQEGAVRREEATC